MFSKFSIVALFALVAVMQLSRPALAGAVNDQRPVALSDTSLQTILDGMYVSGPGINAQADQSNVAWFTGDASGGSATTLLVDTALSASANNFGIYASGDPSRRAMIFGGQNATGDQQLVTYLQNGDILVGGVPVATGFNPSAGFGFYLDIYDAPQGIIGDGDDTTLDYTVYSDDLLNGFGIPSGFGQGGPLGSARMLSFRGDDQTELQVGDFQSGLFKSNSYVLAFESGAPGSTANDFSDFVVIIESVAAVPEPATLLLLGFGVAAIARRRRAA